MLRRNIADKAAQYGDSALTLRIVFLLVGSLAAAMISTLLHAPFASALHRSPLPLILFQIVFTLQSCNVVVLDLRVLSIYYCLYVVPARTTKVLEEVAIPDANSVGDATEEKFLGSLD